MRLLLSILFITNSHFVFSQNKQNIQIKETISTIQKSELSPEWKLHTKDTLNPTFIKLDLNSDNKLDMCGFFKGIESGLMIWGDINNDTQKLYHVNFDSTWYKNGKFGAIMFLKKKGQIITDISSRKKIKLENNSIYIKKLDTQEFILTFINNEFLKIRTK